MKKEKRMSGRFAILAALLLCVLLAVGVVWAVSQEKDILKTEEAQKVMEDLEDNTVGGLFLSMYPTDSYNIQDFLTYRGLNTAYFSQPLESGKNVIRFLKESLVQEHSLEAVYIGVNMREQERGWEEKLLKIIQDNPEVRFHLIIEYPCVEAIADMTKGEQEKLFAWYEKMAELFTPTEECQNVVLFLPGAETWLSGNPGNYMENGEPNEETARYVLGQIICMDSYAVNTDNADEKLLAMQEMLVEKAEQKAIDQEYTFVFFGDSVIGNFQDSMSIPGVVSGIGKVTAINCGYGGLFASKMSEESYGIIDMVDAFLEGSYEEFEEDKAIKTGIPEFYEIQSQIKEDKLVFLISLGINDYLSAYPIEAFEKGIRDAVNGLREVYPQSEIVLMTPNFVEYAEGGTEKINGYTMEQLVEMVRLLSEELDTRYIDIYHETGFNGENHQKYISDLVHPNVLGRYEIGRIICTYLAQWYPAVF